MTQEETPIPYLVVPSQRIRELIEQEKRIKRTSDKILARLKYLTNQFGTNTKTDE